MGTLNPTHSLTHSLANSYDEYAEVAGKKSVLCSSQVKQSYKAGHRFAVKIYLKAVCLPPPGGVRVSGPYIARSDGAVIPHMHSPL